MARYIKGKDGKLAGSLPDPNAVRAPEPSDVPVAAVAESDTPNSDTLTAAYSAYQKTVADVDPLRSEGRAPIRPLTPEDEERREQFVSEALRVPEDPRATDVYLNVVARDMGITAEDARFRFDLLRTGAEAGANFVSDPDTASARFVMYKPESAYLNEQVCGTPDDPATRRAIAELETLAADARRERRQQVETQDDDGFRWVRYENEELSEILRGVKYNEETGDCTVLLRTPNDQDETPRVVEYTYRDVDPSIVRQLVSARSMGRFFSYTLGRLPNGGSMYDPWQQRRITAQDYAFITHYSNFLWPTSRAGGPVPTRRAMIPYGA